MIIDGGGAAATGGGPPTVIMVGPGPQSAGGVWSVIATILDSELADRYGIVPVITHRDGNPLAKGGRGLAGLVHLGRLLTRRRAPDLVWLHAASGFSFRRKAVAALLAHLRGVPHIVHVHGAELHRWYRHISPPERALVRWVLRTARVVVCLSPIWERRIQQITPCRTVAVMNPVAIPALPEPWPAAEGEAEGPARIICTGRLGDRKGSRVLVRALALLRERGHDVRLELAGDGEAEAVRREAVRLGVADRVTLHGWLGPEQVAQLLDACQIFALPSRDEGVPVSLLEAMAHALPVVVTPVGGIPDLVRDGEDGLVVSPDDPPALAAALERLIVDRPWARGLGAAGRRTVTEQAATPVFVEQIGRVLDGVLGRGGRPAAEPSPTPRSDPGTA